MSATSSRSAVLLAQIADTLSVPVETFTAPASAPTGDTAPAAHIAALLFDPEGRRLAGAFVALPPHARKALANVAEALHRDIPPGPEERS